MQGMFPSAIHTSGVTRWHDPDPRGVLPIHGYHVEKELQRIIRQNRFEIRVDHDLPGVMMGCATPAPGREDSWIVPERIEVYAQLQEMGIAHSVEAYQNGELVGGVYGVALGGYFAGESQFHVVRNAGKVAFVYLLMILEQGGFVLHDAWWGSRHLEQFGGAYIPRDEFKRLQARALVTSATFAPLDGPPSFS
ncbi:MAG: leucyl/phenylalanyl-tRNA--protein transferase [Anaerolineae bacterium]|nr:leucyl/phenylalanyl-tRNA--protein transferase [Anaerolineae bacterium]